MVKNKVIILVFLFTAFLIKAAYSAEVIDIGGNAKAIGLGRAYSAAEDSAGCIFYNPAGTSFMADGELTSMYGQLSGDVTYTLLGGVYPTKWGTFGLGYATSSVQNLVLTTVESGRIGSLSEFNYASSVIILTYANSLYQGKLKDNVSYGIRLKSYRKGASSISGGQGEGMALDLGAKYEASERLSAAVLLQNMIGGSIRWGTGSSESLNKAIKIGVKYQVLNILDLLGDLTGDLGVPLEKRMGAELKLGVLTLRGGTEIKPLDNAQQYINLTAGVGLNFRNIVIDYAYYYDSLLSYNSRHFISLSFRFPGAKSKEIKNEDLGLPASLPKKEPLMPISEKWINLKDQGMPSMETTFSTHEAKAVKVDTVKPKNIKKKPAVKSKTRKR